MPQEGSSVLSLFSLIKLHLASLPLASSYSRVAVSSVFWAQNIFLSAQTRGAPLRNLLWEPHAIAVLPSFQPAYHRVPRHRKTKPRANHCYFLYFGHNHGRDCFKLLDAETGNKGRILTRRYVVPSSGAFDTSGNCSRESSRRATGGYLRTDTNACAHCRHAFSSSSTGTCTCSRAGSFSDAYARFCADIRINYAATVYNVETPSFDPPARWSQTAAQGV